jgi:hypothetical protein
MQPLIYYLFIFYFYNFQFLVDQMSVPRSFRVIIFGDSDIGREGLKLSLVCFNDNF